MTKTIIFMLTIVFKFFIHFKLKLDSCNMDVVIHPDDDVASNRVKLLQYNISLAGFKRKSY